MARKLQYEHLDAHERVLIGREVSRYRSKGLSRDGLENRLVGLGYDRESAGCYVDLVVSTDETVAEVVVPTPPAWFERRAGVRF